MTLFVSIAALLAVLALALLTRLFWRRNRTGTAPGQETAIAGLREQLQQLTALHQAGALGEAQYAEARIALERRVAEAIVNAPAAGAPHKPPPSKALLLGLAGFVCLLAAAGYLLMGTPQALDPQVAQAEAAASASSSASDAGRGHAVNSAQFEDMIDKLAARLKERPDDVNGWAMLGRSYAVLGRHALAVPAFKQAVSLRPDDAVLIADYVDALTVTNGSSQGDETSRLIAQALKIDPNNLKALSLAGTAAFDRKDYAGALRHWELLAQAAPGSEFVLQVQGGIDEARRLTGGAPMAPAAAQAPTQRAPAAGASVSGVVTLSAALADRAAPDDTLFVFARPAGGSSMPLAILRKRVKDLPLSFTLDDSMALSPAARLSSAKALVVGARISKRGDATATPGDLQGLSAPVSPGASGLKIEIVEVVAP
jgi:cytochrome c-type biogenesis protein CcmH